MADLQFLNEDLTAFAELSGDQNPLHVDSSYSKRSLFGRPVVHGVLVAIKLIHAISAGRLLKIDTIEVRFLRPIYLNRSYRFEESKSADSHRVSVYSGEILQLQVSLTFAEVDSTSSGEFTTTEIVLLRVLGLSSTFLPAGQLRALLRISEHTGMKDPGTPALLSRFAISFSELQIDEPLDLKSETDERFNTRTITGRGAGMQSLEVESLIRDEDYLFDFKSLQESNSNRWKLDGQTFAITGASSPFGKTLSAIVGLNGGNLVLHTRSLDSDLTSMLHEFRKSGRSVHIVEGNLEDSSTSEKILKLLNQTSGCALILNAFVRGPALGFLEQTESEFSDTLTRSIAATLNPLRAGLTELSEKSKIVFISSTYVSNGHARLSPYVAAKAAIEGVFRSLKFESPRPMLMNLRLPPLKTAGDVSLRTDSRWESKLSPVDAAHAVIRQITEAQSGGNRFVDETIDR